MHKGMRKLAATLEGLNENYGVLVAQDGSCLFVDRKRLTPVSPGDMERRLSNVMVDVSEGGENASYIPAFEALKGNAHRHTYNRVVFTNKPAPADAFNLFRGLGVKQAEGDCDLTLQHVREVIAAGDVETAEGLLSLMAWQIQMMLFGLHYDDGARRLADVRRRESNSVHRLPRRAPRRRGCWRAKG
jgi:hypothetical protein